MELKKNVIAGSYKFKSLREVVSRGGRRKTAGRKSTGNNKNDISDNNLDSIYDYDYDDPNEEVEYIDVN